MTDRTMLDSALSLPAAIALGVIGASVFIVQPGIVQGFVEAYGFSEQQAGYIASIEVWGIATTSVLLALFNSALNWHRVLLISALLFAGGNAASTQTQDLSLFEVARFVTGLGAGSLISLSFTIVGLTKLADRNFGLLVMGVLTFGALGLWVTPWALNTIGMNGALLFFAGLGLIAIPLIKQVPSSGTEHLQIGDDALDLSAALKLTAVIAIFVYFFAQGVIWAYLFLIGVSGGVSEQAVANGLMISQFLGIAGALLPTLLGARFGRRLPLTVGIVGGGAILWLLHGAISALIYGIAVGIYNFAWNMTHPFLLGAMASFDRQGKVVSHAVAAQMLGLAVGPALGAYLLVDGNYSPVINSGIALFLLSWVLILIPVEFHRRAQRKGRFTAAG